MKSSISLVDWPIHTKSLHGVKLGYLSSSLNGHVFRQMKGKAHVTCPGMMICLAVYQLCREFSSPQLLASYYILEVDSYCYGHYSDLTNTQIDLYPHESCV